MTQVSLGYEPRPWQIECHKQRKRFSVLALHRRAGKTELAIAELVDKAMRCQLDLAHFFYVAPYLKQAKAVAWARLKYRVAPLVPFGAVEINESELSVRFTANGALIRIFGGDNPDAMRGVRLDGVVIDEVAQIKPEVWTDIIQPALADRKGWAIFIGTPNGVNLFSELYARARSLDDWHAARYTVYDTNSLDAGEVARLKRDMSEQSFAREMLCDFNAAGNDQLLSLADIELAAERVVRQQDIRFAPVVLGVDVARFGDDRSVIFRRQGLLAHPPRIFRGVDNMDLAAIVGQEIDEHQADAVFIDEGGGSGVIDRLRQLGYDVIGIHFGGASVDRACKNKRMEMWWGMAEWVRQGGVIPNIVDLKQDLGAPIYWHDPGTGKRVLESKQDIKDRGLPSPDLGDALALTFAAPVKSRADRQREAIRGTRNGGDYDPIRHAQNRPLNAPQREYNPLNVRN